MIGSGHLKNLTNGLIIVNVFSEYPRYSAQLPHNAIN